MHELIWLWELGNCHYTQDRNEEESESGGKMMPTQIILLLLKDISVILLL